MAWTAPRTWVAGETVTAAIMNTHVRDNLKALGDPWTAYTPVWTATTTNPVLNNGTLVGAFIQPGKLVQYRIHLTVGSTTTFGTGNYLFSLPATMGSAYLGFGAPLGIASLFDTSASLLNYDTARKNTTTTVALTNPTTGVNVTPTVPWTWAVGDQIEITGAYEAA